METDEAHGIVSLAYLPPPRTSHSAIVSASASCASQIPCQLARLR